MWSGKIEVKLRFKEGTVDKGKEEEEEEEEDRLRSSSGIQLNRIRPLRPTGAKQWAQTL